MSRICPLFSGSTGNSTYIGTSNGSIIIDAGASLKSITASLQNAGGSIDDITAVAVTHTHSDHIKGLRPLLNKTKATLIASADTLELLADTDKIPSGIKTVEIGKKPLETEGLALSFFPTSHDCKGSGGYFVILPDGKKFTLCTDLGIVTNEVYSALSGSDLILLESNHDIEMLKKGPYPPQLKLRILSDIGHISNNTCASVLTRLLSEGTNRFILGHLSQHNNTPLLALSAAEASLMDRGAQNGKDYILNIAKPCNNGVTVI